MLAVPDHLSGVARTVSLCRVAAVRLDCLASTRHLLHIDRPSIILKKGH